MRNLFTVFLFALTGIHGFCQEINGYVLDNNTKTGVPKATVFINGTMIGTLTDDFGKFSLSFPKDQKLPIAVSSVGYEQMLISDYDTSNLIIIYLEPKTYELDEIYVYSKATAEERRNRNTYLERFRDEFLGLTTNSQRCKILNEKDLVFRFDPKTSILKATSQKPLLIVNKALGYNITYYLEMFECSVSGISVFYNGNIFFEEDKDLKGLKLKNIEKRRRLAYRGSRMHFFRALWENQLDSNGYKINGGLLTYDSLVVETNPGIKYLKNKGTISVSYYSKNPNHSQFILKSDSSYFDKWGYFNPEEINWLLPSIPTAENVLNMRMGDQLPYDYRYLPGKR